MGETVATGARAMGGGVTGGAMWAATGETGAVVPAGTGKTGVADAFARCELHQTISIAGAEHHSQLPDHDRLCCEQPEQVH